MHTFNHKYNLLKIATIILLFTFYLNNYSPKVYGYIQEPNVNQENQQTPKKEGIKPEEEKLDPKEEIKAEIERIYNERNKALVSGDASILKSDFDTSQRQGLWSMEHEVKRIQYFNQWASERNMQFKNIESTIRIKKLNAGSKSAKAFLEETYKFDYVYKDDEAAALNSFGVGIRHTITLKNNGEKWIVYNDWYTDCFEDALQGYTGFIQGSQTSMAADAIGEYIATATSNWKYSYNREKAVEYADKYCGAAWGSTNDFKYNKKYRDYNGIGGDCTNFASQVLGDKEAGGLKQDGTWRCPQKIYGHSEGSSAWVNADGLKNYLVYSGKASVIRKGTFKELTAASPNLPSGAISKIQLGDLICYEKKGQIDHFAVVTGFDSKGYPLVNSHTTDRYHVPWDLGWGDKHIKFLLLHVNG